MATYQDFFTDVLNGIGAPVTPGNLYTLALVSVFEGKNNRYNPLNSVVQSGDSTSFNSVGVQDYKTYDNGVAGTISLLDDQAASGVKKALMTGQLGTGVNAFKEFYQSWGGTFNVPNTSQAQTLLATSLGAGTPIGGASSTTPVTNTDPNTGLAVNNAAFTVENTGISTVGTENTSWWNDLDPLTWLSNIIPGVSDVKDAISALADVMGYIAQAFKEFLWLFEPGHFFKVLLYVFGGAMVGGGIWVMVKGAGASDAQVA